jgi:hypothetical protein
MDTVGSGGGVSETAIRTWFRKVLSPHHSQIDFVIAYHFRPTGQNKNPPAQWLARKAGAVTETELLFQLLEIPPAVSRSLEIG